MKNTGETKMTKYTLWEVVTRNGFRKALVKTENTHTNEYNNFLDGDKIIRSQFNPKFFDWGIFHNAGYGIDVKRCKKITIKGGVK